MAECINKKAAISLIKQYAHDAIDDGRYSLDTVDDCIELANRIETLPTADVAPVVHGRWIATHDEFCSCSLCKYPVCVAWGQTNYCPHCGAKMDEKEAVYD